MALNYSGVFYLDKYGTKHTISTMYRYKKGEGYSTVWTSGSKIEDNTDIATPAEYFTFTELSNGTYSIAAADVTNMPSDVIIPSIYNGKYVTKIDNMAFVDATTLVGSAIVSVVIPNSITTIGQEAFRSCSNLISVVIPNSVTVIGAWAFAHCDNLIIHCKAKSQPEGWNADWNHHNCPVVWDYIPPTPDNNFTFTLLSDDTYSIKANGRISDVIDLVIPSYYNGKAVTEIANSAFFDWTFGTLIPNVKTIHIPETITKLNGTAFTMSPQLESVTFRGNSQISRIGHSVFSTCQKLKDIVLPNSVTYIDDSAFYDCSGLESISIPSDVTQMGVSVFRGCSSLKEIVLPAALTNMNSNVFAGCSNLSIYCEADSQPEGWDANWNPDNRPVTWGYIAPLGDDYFTFTERADGTYSVKAKDVSDLPSVVSIPSTYNDKAVTTIDYSAFYGCPNLERVVLPEGITVIDNNAFEECRILKEINLPESLTTINASAFGYCTTLPTITIPSAVDYIGGWAFYNCNALTINCRAYSQPDGWDANWNIDNRPVTWGYTG